MNTYRERVDFFWKWFQANEEKIHDFIENPKKYDPEQTTAFVGNALDLVFSKSSYFEFGGSHEFSFTTAGEHYLFYLLPYLVSRAPVDLKYEWTFSPYKMGGISKTYGYRKEDAVISIENILLRVGYDEKQNVFYVGFYHEEFAKMEEKAALNMFFVLLDALVGENVVEMYIGPIERLTKKTGKMFPMYELGPYIEKKLEENKRTFFRSPSDSYSAYEMDPAEEEGLRQDLYAGTTCCIELVEEFYQNKRDMFDDFEKSGAKACFLYYNCANDDPELMLQLREEILDKISEFVLGEKDSGNEIGILLGTGFGKENAYIDLLLYDEEIFLQEVKPLLRQYDYDFYLADFREGGPVKNLTENKGAASYIN
ncbi:MAG: hypothetical protein LBQ96_06210 [Fusobacteriaceae bacterium]|jgi:hypothetical protein|nr:hypothetical protein [Fusobacteriaceae bacterium]